MTYDVAVDYWLAMTVIDSDEIIKQSQASSVHAYDKRSRKDYYKELNKNMKLVEKDIFSETMNTQEAAMQLAQSMLGK